MPFNKLLIATVVRLPFVSRGLRARPALPRLRSIPPTMPCRCTSAPPTPPTKFRAAARALISTSKPWSPRPSHGLRCAAPGYGFLSENTLLARRCAEEGITFVGPSPEALDLFGDKAKAKALAKETGVPSSRAPAARPRSNRPGSSSRRSAPALRS